jgi:hypothetical protein
MKKFSEITIDDYRRCPVWEYVPNSEDADIWLKEVRKRPARHLNNRIVGTRVTLRNGEKCWAIVGNISVNSKRATEQFLTLSVEKDSQWFNLARYHDVDYARRGPQQLAQFLNMEVNEVFPINYDISDVVSDLSEVVVGAVPVQPSEILSQDELVALAIQSSA